MTKRRVGILTGGGDCSGLNAVLRGFVHRMHREHDVTVIGSEDAFNGFLDAPARLYPLNLGHVGGILAKGGTILGTTNRGDPFAYPVTQDGETQLVDRSAEVKAAFVAHELDGVVCVGGDGTLGIAKRLMDTHGIPVFGVPKTIDNDVAATDYTFGFWTAVETATRAIDALHTTAESHDRIMVVELMGREAGFIALAAGIAGGADVVLIPEIPFDLAAVIAKIRRRRQYGRSFSIVAVAEGAAPTGGQALSIDLGDRGTGAMKKLGGIGHWLAAELSETCDMDARVTVLGHLQRGGSPVAFDRVLSTAFGVAAADAVVAGKWGSMVALDKREITVIPLAQGLNENRRVSVEGTWVKTARGVGICLGESTTGGAHAGDG